MKSRTLKYNPKGLFPQSRETKHPFPEFCPFRQILFLKFSNSNEHFLCISQVSSERERVPSIQAIYSPIPIQYSAKPPKGTKLSPTRDTKCLSFLLDLTLGKHRTLTLKCVIRTVKCFLYWLGHLQNGFIVIKLQQWLYCGSFQDDG